MEKTKQYTIPRLLFIQAYKLVKANAGAAGDHQESLEYFAKNLKDNLYKLWNRMSSGLLLSTCGESGSYTEEIGR